MSKPIKINLNEYERVPTIDDLEGYQSVILTPMMLKDGTQPPTLFFRKGKKKDPLVSDVTGLVWNKDICINNKVSEDQYIKLVDWWFGEAIKDVEYKKLINDTFFKNGFDPKITWDSAQAWLKTCTPSERKTHLHKFIMTKMRKNYQRVIGGINRSKRK